jgi:DNA polymerase-3 subunit delta
LTVNAGFNWASLLQMAVIPSLFAEQKIIELQMPSGKPGREGYKIENSVSKTV